MGTESRGVASSRSSQFSWSNKIKRSCTMILATTHWDTSATMSSAAWSLNPPRLWIKILLPPLCLSGPFLIWSLHHCLPDFKTHNNTHSREPSHLESAHLWCFLWSIHILCLHSAVCLAVITSGRQPLNLLFNRVSSNLISYHCALWTSLYTYVWYYVMCLFIYFFSYFCC